MLARKPFSITAKADPSAVDQEIQWLAGAPIRDLHLDPSLTSAQHRIVGHRPVEPRHLDQACDQTDGLAKRQAEQHFQRQTGLNGAVREGLGVDHACRFGPPAKALQDRTRRTTILAASGKRYSQTSSSCGSGRWQALACQRSNHQHSQDESLSPICATTSFSSELRYVSTFESNPKVSSGFVEGSLYGRNSQTP